MKVPVIVASYRQESTSYNRWRDVDYSLDSCFCIECVGNSKEELARYIAIKDLELWKPDSMYDMNDISYTHVIIENDLSFFSNFNGYLENSGDVKRVVFPESWVENNFDISILDDIDKIKKEIIKRVEEEEKIRQENEKKKKEEEERSRTELLKEKTEKREREELARLKAKYE